MTENASAPLLQVQGLNAWYGAAQILFDVSLQVGRGEVVALDGPQRRWQDRPRSRPSWAWWRGAVACSFWGKTLRGASRTTLPAWAWAMCREERRIFTDLSVMDNLEVGRQRPRRWPDGTPAPEWTPEKLFALFPNLGEMPLRPGGRMSGGRAANAHRGPHAHGPAAAGAAR